MLDCGIESEGVCPECGCCHWQPVMIFNNRSEIKFMASNFIDGTVDAIIDWEDYVGIPFRKDNIPADICVNCGMVLTI